MNFFITMAAECVGPDSALRKVGAMRASSRAQGIRPSIRSRKISRRVLRSHSRLAKVNCRRRCRS